VNLYIQTYISTNLLLLYSRRSQMYAYKLSRQSVQSLVRCFSFHQIGLDFINHLVLTDLQVAAFHRSVLLFVLFASRSEMK